MLIAFIVLVVALLSGSVAWHPAAASIRGAAVPTITPQDPPSLTLALIGAGMLAIYFTLSRTARGRRPLAKTRYIGKKSSGQDLHITSDVPPKSRDAA